MYLFKDQLQNLSEKITETIPTEKLTKIQMGDKIPNKALAGTVIKTITGTTKVKIILIPFPYISVGNLAIEVRSR